MKTKHIFLLLLLAFTVVAEAAPAGAQRVAFPEVKTPLNGEILTLGTTRGIETHVPGGKVKIALLLFQGNDQKGIIGTAWSDKVFVWTVGSSNNGMAAPGTGYWIKAKIIGTQVSSGKRNTFTITSDGTEHAIPLHAAPKALQVTAPNGGEKWKRGSQRNISWTYLGPVPVKLKLMLFREDADKQNKPVGLIGTVMSNAGPFSWTVGTWKGNMAEDGEGYRIKAKVVGQKIFDISDNPFTIYTLNPAQTPPLAVVPFWCGTDCTVFSKGVGPDLHFSINTTAPVELTLKISETPPNANGEFGNIPSAYASNGPTTSWQPILKGLKPNTVYYYVLSATDAGNNRTFKVGVARTNQLNYRVTLAWITLHNDADAGSGGECEFRVNYIGTLFTYGSLDDDNWIHSGETRQPNLVRLVTDIKAPTLTFQIIGREADTFAAVPEDTAQRTETFALDFYKDTANSVRVTGDLLDFTMGFNFQPMFVTIADLPLPDVSHLQQKRRAVF